MAAQSYKATTLNATEKAILTSAIREMKKAQQEKVAATSLYGTGPFTASQLIELQRQIAIHYHLVYKVPLPSGLLFDISNLIQQRRACKSSNTTSVRIERPKQGFTKDMLDSEPGRCRRTDGKKWRCSIDVFQNKKYCERHIKRSRNHASKSAKVNVNGENAASGSSLERSGLSKKLPINKVINQGLNAASGSSLERSGLSNKLPINKVMNQGLNAASGSSLERSGLSNKLPINNVINQGLNAASGSSLERSGLSNKLPINNLINQGLNAASGSSLERFGLSNKLPINNVINQGLNAASGSSLEGSGLSNKLWINEVTQQGLDTFPLNKANAGGETEDPELLFDDLPDLDFGIPSTDSVMDASQLYQNQNSDYSIESFDYLFPLDEQQTENQNQESLLPFPFPSLHDNLLLTPSWSSGQFLPIQVDSGVADVLNVPTGDQSNISPFSSGSSSGGPLGEILESYKGTQNL